MLKIFQVILTISLNAAHYLKHILKDYTPLHKNDLQLRHNSFSAIIQLTLDKNEYVILLEINRALFHRNFEVEIHNKTHITKLNNPTEGHYIGHIKKAPNSHASFHIHDAIVTGTLECGNNIWHIEPSFRHIKTKHNFHMIAYRDTDVLNNFGNKETGEFCGHPSHSSPDKSISSLLYLKHKTYTIKREKWNHKQKFKHQRNRRQATPNTVCGVMLVIDYKYFNDIGGSDAILAKSSAVSIFESTAKTFRDTNFELETSKEETEFKGYTMQLKKVIVHTESSEDVSYNGKHPDNTYGSWESDVQLHLQYLSYGKGFNKYCLVHLFTNYDYDGGTLGLAYVANPHPYVFS